MESGKDHLEEKCNEEGEESVAKEDVAGPATNPKERKDKAIAVRSKHSILEQRRRSKINERYQILRELIPNSDQRKDTASFLSEVVQYVQYLQEQVQNYEGPFQPRGSDPTKAMPWRTKNWRIPNFAGPLGSPFPGKFDESTVNSPTIQQGQQNSVDVDCAGDLPSQPKLLNKEMGTIPLQTIDPVFVASDGSFSHEIQGQPSDATPMECPSAIDLINFDDELTIDGGTINISSVYSEALLSSLTQSLESAGVDLSRASISVQIKLGKQAEIGFNAAEMSTAGDQNIPMPSADSIPMPSADQLVGTFDEDSNKMLKTGKRSE